MDWPSFHAVDGDAETCKKVPHFTKLHTPLFGFQVMASTRLKPRCLKTPELRGEAIYRCLWFIASGEHQYALKASQQLLKDYPDLPGIFFSESINPCIFGVGCYEDVHQDVHNIFRAYVKSAPGFFYFSSSQFHALMFLVVQAEENPSMETIESEGEIEAAAIDVDAPLTDESFDVEVEGEAAGIFFFSDNGGWMNAFVGLETQESPLHALCPDCRRYIKKENWDVHRERCKQSWGKEACKHCGHHFAKCGLLQPGFWTSSFVLFAVCFQKHIFCP